MGETARQDSRIDHSGSVPSSNGPDASEQVRDSGDVTPCSMCGKETNTKAGETLDENGHLVGIICDECWDSTGEGLLI